MSKYLSYRREGLAPPSRCVPHFAAWGHALWTTTAILVAGFLVLASSGYETMWVLGLMVAITLTFALLVDFLLLPALLMAVDTGSSDSPLEAMCRHARRARRGKFS